MRQETGDRRQRSEVGKKKSEEYLSPGLKQA